MRKTFLLALLFGVAGCDGGRLLLPGDVEEGGDGGGPRRDLGASAPGDLSTRSDLAGAPDLAPSCASLVCGVHAHCDPQSVRCTCDAGHGGDPVAGCTPQTPCGACAAHAHCDAASQTCACNPGYVLQGASCLVAPIGDVAGRSAAAVCDAWRAGHVTDDFNPWKAGAGECDAGSLSRAGIDDTMRRIAMFRWLAGLYPSNEDPAASARGQLCAVMESANGMLNHQPPPTWRCYTSDGAAAAASSNLAAGTGNGADAIDLFMDDWGVPSLGHRRWVLNPPLDGVGVGYARGYTCLGVFGGGNQGPPARWQSVPNAGPTPLGLASYGTWSFHSPGIDPSNAQITVVRRSDGAPLPVMVKPLPFGYGVDAVGFERSGWSPRAGEVYTVSVGGTGLGPVSYEVAPVDCN